MIRIDSILCLAMIFKGKQFTAIHSSLTILALTLTLVIGWSLGWAEDTLTLSQMSLLDNEETLKVGDRLSYTVIEDRDPLHILFVNDRGEINVPLLGYIRAESKTCRELAFIIKEELKVDYYYQATVLLSHQTDSNSRGRVILLCEVRSPGPYLIPVDEVLMVSDTILRAGGFLPNADKEKVAVIRKDPHNSESEIRTEIDIGTIFETGQFENDIAVEPNDLILIPRLEQAGGQFSVVGAVNAPGLYDLPSVRDFTVSKAILRAGGFSEYADKKKVKLIRADASLADNEQTVEVNVADILEKGIRDFDPLVKPDDIIRVKEKWILF